MYVDVDRRLRVHLMDMTPEEARALVSMIEGAALPHRQVFWTVREQFKHTPLDKHLRSGQSEQPEQPERSEQQG